jgi:hypothetical protein
MESRPAAAGHNAQLDSPERSRRSKRRLRRPRLPQLMRPEHDQLLRRRLSPRWQRPCRTLTNRGVARSEDAQNNARCKYNNFPFHDANPFAQLNCVNRPTLRGQSKDGFVSLNPC